MDEDLTIKARIDDELSAPLENIREDLHRVGDEATTAGRRASSSSRGWATMGKVAKAALVGIATGVAAAGYATYRLMKSSISQASDLNESLNAVNVSYGKQAKAVKQLGREAAKSIGMSNVEFNSMAVQFSSFAKTIGGGGKGTVKTLDAITTRAADFASVMNIEVAEATALFQSGLAGESEPLRKYGINLSAAAVGAYAVKAGLSESATEMTDAAKIQATYGLLMEKTNNTQGDFANTSDSLANSSRILSARFDNVQAKLGKALLPIMGKVVGYLNREGIPAFKRFSTWFTEDGLPAIERFGEKARVVYRKHLPQVKETLSDVRDVVEPVAKAAGDMVEAFLNMPSWARKLLIGGGVGATLAAKLGVPKLLAGSKPGGGLLGLVSKAKPLPVFVVNNGIDLPGGGTKPKGIVGKTVSAVGKYVLPVAAVAASLKGVDMALKSGAASDPQTRDSLNGVGVVTPSYASNEGYVDFKKKSVVVEKKILDMTAKAQEFNRSLFLAGSAKVEPKFGTPGLPEAKALLQQFLQQKIDAGKPVTPYVVLDGFDRAMAQIDTLKTAMHTIPSAGLDGGVPYASGAGGRRNREYGGSVKAGEAYVVGERRAELFVPDRSGTVLPRVPGGGGGGGVTIEANGVRVEVINPTSNVDVEVAVRKGIENYVRDREERS